MNDTKIDMTTTYAPIPERTHGACPTCGHCKCCERAQAVPFVPTPYPQVPTWPYMPTYPIYPSPWITYTGGHPLGNTGVTLPGEIVFGGRYQ